MQTFFQLFKRGRWCIYVIMGGWFFFSAWWSMQNFNVPREAQAESSEMMTAFISARHIFFVFIIKFPFYGQDETKLESEMCKSYKRAHLPFNFRMIYIPQSSKGPWAKVYIWGLNFYTYLLQDVWQNFLLCTQLGTMKLAIQCKQFCLTIIGALFFFFTLHFRANTILFLFRSRTERL